MTAQAWLLLVSLLLLSAGAVLGVFVAVPWSGRYLFRSDLWEIRDRIVDDVLADALPAHHAGVQRLISRAEGAVRFADSFGLASVITLHMAAHRSGQRVSAKPLPMDGLDAAQRKLLKEYDEEIAERAVRYTLTPSGGGWILTLLSFPVLVLMLFGQRLPWRRMTPENIRRHVGRDFRLGADALAARSHA